MTIKAKALIAAFLFTAAAPVPALAAQQQPAAAAAQQRKLAPSKEAQPAIIALQKAANENRLADLPALSQAVLAVAKTPTDRYFAYQLQLKPALAANNTPLVLSAIEGMMASGLPEQSEMASLAFNAAKLNYNANQLDKASTQVARAIAANPNDPEYYQIQAEIYNKQKRPAEAVAALQKAMSVGQQTGKPVSAAVSERALAIAYNNKLPASRDIALSQLRSSPNPKTWRQAIKIYEQTSNLPVADKIDLFRLQRVTNSFDGEGDYYPYVDALLTRGLPGEAKGVLDEAFAANKLDRAKAGWKDMAASANARVAADRAGLAASERAALSGGTFRATINTGDAFYGYGDYSKAAGLYRAALSKSGADADLANLRLGVALARTGDKAGATAALNAVKGTRAGIAQMWLLYLQAQA